MAGLGRFLRGSFASPPPDRHALDRVKAWARAVLQADDETALSVSEILCADPGCPGIETVILVMAPGARARAVKVAKAASEVTEQDVGQALLS